ncbi:MAG: hypothetical protein FWG68_11690 [Defluviitaleaceae bacterium]|nr:hypothetical protein [Defluviitaleaceae bacterium]
MAPIFNIPGLSRPIDADPAVLNEVARMLRDVANAMQNDGTKLGRARNDTQAAWQSESSQIFMDSITRTEGRIRDNVDELVRLANALSSISIQIVETERRVKALSVGNRA